MAQFSQLTGALLDVELNDQSTVLYTTAQKSAGMVERRQRALKVVACRRCGTEFVCGGAGNPHKNRKYCSFKCSYQPASSEGQRRCASCKQLKPETPEYFRPNYSKLTSRLYHSYCKECYEAKRKATNRALRLEVLTKYSGGRTPTCACCGEAGYEFLTIDHINNDGAEHRRAMGGRNKSSSGALLAWLRRHGYPEGFQVLCWNCNCAKAHNGGVCPHREA